MSTRVKRSRKPSNVSLHPLTTGLVFVCRTETYSALDESVIANKYEERGAFIVKKEREREKVEFDVWGCFEIETCFSQFIN